MTSYKPRKRRKKTGNRKRKRERERRRNNRSFVRRVARRRRIQNTTPVVEGGQPRNRSRPFIIVCHQFLCCQRSVRIVIGSKPFSFLLLHDTDAKGLPSLERKQCKPPFFFIILLYCFCFLGLVWVMDNFSSPL